jgi:hypothetical protein
MIANRECRYLKINDTDTHPPNDSKKSTSMPFTRTGTRKDPNLRS